MSVGEIKIDLDAQRSGPRRQARFAQKLPKYQKYQPEYELRPAPRAPGCWEVLNRDTGAIAGWARSGDDDWLTVCDDLFDPIACVQTVDFIVPTIAMHYKHHPHRWEREFRGDWTRWTQYGELRVTKIATRRFQVSRNDHSLHDDRWHLATFSTLSQAKRAADFHMRQGYPNSDPIPDGLSWDTDPDIDWWRRHD